MNQQGNTSSSSHSKDSPSILVVDDDPDLRDGLCDALVDEGYSVTAASNGADAVEHLAADPRYPDLILMDLKMPVMDGYEFLERRVKDPGLSKIPVIVVSANVQKPVQRPGVETLPKPIQLDALLRLIRRQLRWLPAS